ncbi:MAG: tripartite tricarboxylate transporter substrate binding protein [Betaproteobacteria bacterium]|nr:tripartite tricarboxylate transporter substrate binding protein [Betaproteobacteria bacterium]
MQASRLRSLAAIAALLSVCSAQAAGPGQPYPNRPMRLVVPFAPGGTVDIIGRIVAAKLSERLGQPIVVDNRGGANSMIGSEIVARASPDGHTLLIVAAGFAVNPSLQRNMPYDTERDLAPIGLLGNSFYVMVIHAGIPANTVSEFIAWAKSRPGQVNYASTGLGSPPHLAAELFKISAGVDMTHIPYKGGGALMPDLLAGRIATFFGTMATVAPHVHSGKLRALAVSTAKRATTAPELPTFIESGLAGYEVAGWYGLLAPGKTPRAIVNRLDTELRAVLDEADSKERFLKHGMEVEHKSAAAFAALIRSEIAKWQKVVRRAGIKPE